MQDQDQRSIRFANAITDYYNGLRLGRSLDTATEAIGLFRLAAAEMESLGLPAREAVVYLHLGATLCQRTRRHYPQLNLADAAEAERVLDQALETLRTVRHASRRAIEGSILAWRARCRTFLAESDRELNLGAIRDGRRAVKLLKTSGGVLEPKRKHDLANAHLHLARAHFFQACAERQSGWRPRLLDFIRIVVLGRGHFTQTHIHAEKTLRLIEFAPELKIEADWLLEQAKAARGQ